MEGMDLLFRFVAGFLCHIIFFIIIFEHKKVIIGLVHENSRYNVKTLHLSDILSVLSSFRAVILYFLPVHINGVMAKLHF